MTRRIITGLLVCLSSLACVMGVVQQKDATPVVPAPQATETAAPPSPPVWTAYTNGNDVNDLAVDPAGNLWAATMGGLVKWKADGTYTKYTTIDGLPDNEVFSVDVAPDGAVWVGTFDGGLARFDGHGWRTYTTADGLPNNRVWAVAAAPDGTIWFSAYTSGVTRFDGVAWTTYTTADGLPSNDVYALDVAPDGMVWAYTGGGDISHFDPSASGGTPASGHSGERWTPLSSKPSADTYPSCIAAAEGGTVWVGTDTSLSYFDGVEWTIYTEQDSPAIKGVSSIAIAPDGAVWFGSIHGGLTRFEDTGSPRWVTYTEKDGLPSNAVDGVTVAPDGDVWASTLTWDEGTYFEHGQGVSRFDGRCWATYTTDDKLIASRVNNAVVTTDGLLWFFTSAGPACFDPAAGPGRGGDWVTCPGSGMGVTISPSIVLAPDGALWSITYPGIARFDGTSWTTYSAEDILPGVSFGNLILAPDGTIWVGTYTYASRSISHGHGVARFDGETWTVYTAANSRLADNFVNDIALAADGALWFGTRTGVSRFDGETWTTYDVITVLPTNDLPYNEIRRVITTPGGLVCCELTGAVSCLDGESWTAYTQADGLYAREGIGLTTILSTAVDQDGALWLGTNEGGISRFDGASWTTYTTADGLPHNQVNAIAVAPDGAIWVGTLGGAARFDPSASSGRGGSTWTTFTTADGLADNIVQAIVVASDGDLWFGTYSGISRYGPPK
ncbi:MAG: hypothetical protein JW918_06115 [Anaerolineae bacterium]|nr:hypothetical protein [Anaerolineae bacterium]